MTKNEIAQRITEKAEMFYYAWTAGRNADKTIAELERLCREYRDAKEEKKK